METHDHMACAKCLGARLRAVGETMGSGESDARRIQYKAYTDGPLTHYFRSYTKGTQYIIIDVTDVDGVKHKFHVPQEVYDAIEKSVIYGVDKR